MAFGGNGFKGYHAENIVGLSSPIQTAADNVMGDIGTVIQTSIIDELAKCWFAQEGIDFVDDFISAVKNVKTTIEKAFNAFKDAVQTAGNEWSDKGAGGEGKGETITLASISVPDVVLNNSMQLKDSQGRTGVDDGLANALIANLGNVRKELEEQLQTRGNELKADEAFIGMGQGAAVEECFNEVLATIGTVFDSFTEGPESLKVTMAKFIDSYGTFAQSVTEGFRSASSQTSSTSSPGPTSTVEIQ